MQLETGRSICPICSADVDMSLLLHHMMCAYVGPDYDFTLTAKGYVCPKCRREILEGDQACEIVGTSARCKRCSKEMVLTPPSTTFPSE
jgi:hypothetical protein